MMTAESKRYTEQLPYTTRCQRCGIWNRSRVDVVVIETPVSEQSAKLAYLCLRCDDALAAEETATA